MLKKLRIRISQIFCALILIMFVCSGSMWEAKAPFLSSFFFFIGVSLIGIASLGRLWCSVYISGYKTDKLITVGPYSISRNPLYFFSLLGALGVGLASETLLIPLLIIIAFSLYYPSVIKSEETKLKKLHRVQFESYIAHVPKFFPKMSSLTEPQEYIVKPVIFKKHIFSSLWFIWFIGILELIEELHNLKVIPILFSSW